MPYGNGSIAEIEQRRAAGRSSAEKRAANHAAPRPQSPPRLHVTLWQDGAGAWCVQTEAGHALPASLFEVALWLELQEVKAALVKLQREAA